MLDAAATWVESDNWKMAASSNSIAQVAWTSGSELYMAAICQRNRAMNSADSMPKEMHMPVPTQATKRARAGLPSPMDWPTRVSAPIAKLSGTMNTSEMKFSATWWADTCTTPKR